MNHLISSRRRSTNMRTSIIVLAIAISLGLPVRSHGGISIGVTTHHSGTIIGDEVILGCGCKDQSHAFLSNHETALFVRLESYSIILPLEIIRLVTFLKQDLDGQGQVAQHVSIVLVDKTEIRGSLQNLGPLTIKVDGKAKNISINEIEKFEVREGSDSNYQPKRFGNGQTDLVLQSLPKRLTLNLTNAGFFQNISCINGCFFPESLHSSTSMINDKIERTIAWNEISSICSHFSSGTRNPKNTIKVELKDNSTFYTRNIGSVGIIGISKIGKFDIFTYVEFKKSFRFDF
jgi:hypothetical protein